MRDAPDRIDGPASATTDTSAPVAVARAIEILADLVGFDTESSKSNLALIAYVEALLAARGITAELLPDDTGLKANLLATIGPVRAGGVILSGHTDVVPVAGQHWTSDPFVLTRRGDRLYGRGTADMKAFLACTLAAVEFVSPAMLERPVHLAFSYDEEIGCLGAPRLIEHISATTAGPAAAIVGEPSSMNLIGSHKSVHLYTVTVTGVPAHSSAAHLGFSANTVAIRLMSVLVEIADALTAPNHRNRDFEPPYSTLTIGLMHGGTAANILAAEADFTFDLRCLPDYHPDELLAPFHAKVEAIRRACPPVTITVETRAAVPPLKRVSDGVAERLVRSVTGDNADMTAASYGAEAGQFQQAGFSTVICGPGSMDQGHQPDEFIEVGEIERCMAFMGKLFLELSRAVTTT